MNITLWIVMLSSGPNFHNFDTCESSPRGPNMIVTFKPDVAELEKDFCNRYKVEVASFTAWKVGL